MSSSQKKPSILGASMLNFIANMAKNPKDSSEASTAEVSDQSESESNQKGNETTDLNKAESQNLASHLKNELNIMSDEDALMESKAERDDTVKSAGEVERPLTRGFNLLSKSEIEFNANSPFRERNVLKGCKWSPDGTCILTSSDDSVLRLFDTNADMVNVDGTEPIEIVQTLDHIKRYFLS